MDEGNEPLAKQVDEFCESFCAAHRDLRDAIAAGQIDLVVETLARIKVFLSLEDADKGPDDQRSYEESE